MLQFLFCLFLNALVVECITELFIKDSLFYPIKKKFISSLVKKHPNLTNFFAELLSCGRCFSGWVAFALTITTRANFLSQEFLYTCPIILLFVVWVSSWRLSNIIHHLVDKLSGNKASELEEGY